MDGNRLAVAACIVIGIMTAVWILISAGAIDVGAKSSAATVFGSGLTSGVVTIVTIALSINQLILSRVFDAPNSLTDRLEGTLELRRTVEEYADVPSSPNDPAAFLSTLAATIGDRAAALDRAIQASDWDPPEHVTEAVRDIVDYGENIDDHLSEGSDIEDVLHVVLGTEYALNLTAVRHLRKTYADSFSASIRKEFDALEDLLESLAVARQFFKTLSLQEDFARLSRFLVYSGVVALVITFALTLVYRTESVTLPPSLLPVVISLGIGAIVTPFSVFVAYVLRAATIAERTVSVGPFIPPAAQ